MSIAITPGSAAAGLPGLGVTDPQNMQWCFSYNSGFFLYAQNGSNAYNYTSNGGTFWTIVGRMGNYVTGMTNDTYFTIVDITGSKAGFVCSVLGPMADVNQTFTTTIKFTIDGTETIVAHDAVKNDPISASRAGLGCVAPSSVYGIDNAAGTDAIYAQGNAPSVVDPFTDFQGNSPYVNFDESLKIEIKCDNIDTTSSTRRYAGATWRYYD